mgnify:CR=1 FL=1
MMDRLRELLERDEGCLKTVYLCSELVPTFGVGHAVTADDPEHGWPVGAPVSDHRVSVAFQQDVKTAIADAMWLHPDLADMPEDAQITIISLAFQLGGPNYGFFVRHHAAIEIRDWIEAAAQLRNSKLYRQTTARTKRHAQRLETLA